MISDTGGAVFDTADIFCIAAAVFKEVQRAVAEEAVLIFELVAGKILAFGIGKMLIAQLVSP